MCSNPFIDWISLIKRVNAAEWAEYNSISAAQSLRSSRVQWCPCEFSQGTTVSTWPCDIPRNCIALITGCMRKKEETFEFRNNVGGTRKSTWLEQEWQTRHSKSQSCTKKCKNDWVNWDNLFEGNTFTNTFCQTFCVKVKYLKNFKLSNVQNKLDAV